MLQRGSGGGPVTSVRPAREEGVGLSQMQKEAAARLWHRCVCLYYPKERRWSFSFLPETISDVYESPRLV